MGGRDTFRISFTAFSGTLAGRWIASTAARTQPVLVWDAGIEDNGLNHCNKMPAPRWPGFYPPCACVYLCTHTDKKTQIFVSVFISHKDKDMRHYKCVVQLLKLWDSYSLQSQG